MFMKVCFFYLALVKHKAKRLEGQQGRQFLCYFCVWHEQRQERRRTEAQGGRGETILYQCYRRYK